MIIWIVLAVVCTTAVAILFISRPSFGRKPRGERLERIRCSPNYRDGQFRNRHEVPHITSGNGRVRTLWDFLFRENEGLKPKTKIPVIQTDLRKIEPDQETLVWFGHSSYLIQTQGKRILVDPVFYKASPVSFVNKPFKGTDAYKPQNMPDIDILIISHDHWDHLDHRTVKELKNRIGKVICPLGVGEHFKYWGFGKGQIIELDWNENTALCNDLVIHCLPARHFSGRGLTSNQSLWASYLVQTPSRNIYIGGDSGYDTHFAEIGKRFSGIDLAILENGQYSGDWKYIHLMPTALAQAAKELGAKKILTVHHSKYAMARHRWDEPLMNALNAAKNESLDILLPTIGEIIKL